MASLGPPFVTVTVNTTLLPTVGVALSTILVRERSAEGTGAVVTEASSSSPLPVPLPGVESGSPSLTARTCAALVYGPDALTVAVMFSARLDEAERLPMVQSPDPLAYVVPVLALSSLTYVYPAGSSFAPDPRGKEIKVQEVSSAFSGASWQRGSRRT